MAKKVQLGLTLAALQTLSLAVLAVLFSDTTKQEPPKEADTTEKLLEELLKVAQPLPEADPVPASALKTSLPTFKHKGKNIKVLIPKVDIPGIGVRTALELANDTSTVDHLIKIGCLGSVIAEV